MFAAAMPAFGREKAASEPADAGQDRSPGKSRSFKMMPHIVPIPPDMMLELIPSANEPHLFLPQIRQTVNFFHGPLFFRTVLRVGHSSPACG